MNAGLAGISPHFGMQFVARIPELFHFPQHQPARIGHRGEPALHGGGIEPGTSELCLAVAGDNPAPLSGAARVLIGEGAATVAACVDALGIPGAAALGGNLKAAAATVRELAPGDRPKEWATDNAPEDDSDLVAIKPSQEPPALPPAPARVPPRTLRAAAGSPGATAASAPPPSTATS